MLDADDYMRTAITYKNKKGDIIEANPADDTFLLIEPYSGATLNAVLNAQANLYFEPDSLF